MTVRLDPGELAAERHRAARWFAWPPIGGWGGLRWRNPPLSGGV